MITITTVQSPADVQGILTLQQANLRQHLSLDAQIDQGFVTVNHDPEVLTRMNAAAPSVIAKDGDTVVGYCLTMLPEFANDIPELLPLFESVNTIVYQGKPMRKQAYYVMGQVCVGAGYRGQQVFDRMYQHQREVYSGQYHLLITDISEKNTRSQRAHERVGFKPLETFYDPTLRENWIVVVWDWQA
ncbi:GNAT family N-acetyltransferase [Spirosoma sp. KUDC1026]|uniref:GNAT family N-acetyltransferase n=1 Tax=Spirosoma sp. KUDC1026 TaxID=2745947 RepID=UPI00159BA65D|nr:GNAT family N-acetyltransferase [Spirosoma sp. KUDC1026]QKZ12330.1 GNAT family N-acetyltransferase [Spirosoma sp. KUDC1026]